MYKVMVYGHGTNIQWIFLFESEVKARTSIEEIVANNGVFWSVDETICIPAFQVIEIRIY
jgi:hypothetical protein